MFVFILLTIKIFCVKERKQLKFYLFIYNMSCIFRFIRDEENEYNPKTKKVPTLRTKASGLFVILFFRRAKLWEAQTRMYFRHPHRTQRRNARYEAVKFL